MMTGKLGIGLGTDSPKKTIDLKYTDYSINKFQSDFSKGRKTIRTKILNSGVKGLLLSQSITTKKKYFIQQFWFDGKADHWSVGEFRPNIFGIKECQIKVVAIMKTHTDDNGLWIKSPKITQKHNKDRVSKAEKENRQMLTVKECLERLCKVGFPKIKREGLLAGTSIRDICLHLIGKNKRTKHLEYDDDNFGNGIVTFRACKVYNTNKPQSWDDLFIKFPSGHGVLTKVNGKKLKGVSMYDHPVFSKYLIEELTPGLINSYLDEHSPSWGTKRKMICALQVLWSNSKKYMGINRPLDPTTKEALEVKLPGISKAKNSKYNKVKNGPDEMQKMWLSFQKQSTKHPFQAELLMLMMTAGRHFIETSKVKKTDVYPKGKKGDVIYSKEVKTPKGTFVKLEIKISKKDFTILQMKGLQNSIWIYVRNNPLDCFDRLRKEIKGLNVPYTVKYPFTEHEGYRILVGKGDKIKQNLYEKGKGNISKMTKEMKDWEVYTGVTVKNTKKKTIN